METRIAVSLISLLIAAQIVQALIWLWAALPVEMLLVALLPLTVMGLIAWGGWVRWLHRQPSEWRTYGVDRHLPLVMSAIGVLLGLWSSL